MAKFTMPLGEMSGSVGNMTYRKDGNTTIASKKITSQPKPGSDKQRVQRSKMKVAGELSQVFEEVHKIGMKVLKGKKSTHNHFVSLNMPTISVDENFNASFEPSKLVCSKGNLTAPKVAVSIKDKAVRISQTAQPHKSYAMPDDRIFLVLFNKNLKLVDQIELNERSTSGSTSANLGEDWQAEDVVCYSYAVSANGKRASRTIYFLPEIETE